MQQKSRESLRDDMLLRFGGLVVRENRRLLLRFIKSNDLFGFL